MSSGVSEVSERANAAERTSEKSRAEQVKEWAVRVNERTDERVALYFRFLVDLAHSVVDKDERVYVRIFAFRHEQNSTYLMKILKKAWITPNKNWKGISTIVSFFRRIYSNDNNLIC